MTYLDAISCYTPAISRPARIVDTTDDDVLLEWAASSTTLTLQEWAEALAQPPRPDVRSVIADALGRANAQLSMLPGDITYVPARGDA